MVRVVLHTCRLCSQDLHLDYDVLTKHIRSHAITFQEYSRHHLVPSKTDPYKAGSRGVSPSRRQIDHRWISFSAP